MRRKWILWVCVAVLLIGTLGGMLYVSGTNHQLRKNFLKELDHNRGRYDARSVVLYNTNRSDTEKLAEDLGARLRITGDGSFAALYLPEGMTIRDVVANAKYSALLPQMAIDYQVHVSELMGAEEESGMPVPSRPEYPASDAHYDDQRYLAYLNAGLVWESCTGQGITVAVIDTGIDTDHPEFAGRISSYSYNATEDKIVRDYCISDGTPDWSLVEDEVGHGTAVAGVLAAGMNTDGIMGIAPDVEILVIKAECDENGNFKRSSDLVFGLYYAIERDVQVVNMSFGVGKNLFAEAIQLAYDSDIVCVAASGNSGTAALTYPAADPLVIGVGALESDGWRIADYSNYGDNVNLMAPGSVYTTALGGGYDATSGTSFAAPQVAGAIALYLQHEPYASVADVTELLYASCRDLGSPGCDWYYGFGVLDLHAMLREERGTVTFEMLTDELENEQALFIRNHTMQELPEPERLYAVFDGWYYDDMFTEEYDYYRDVFVGDLTLYAKWVNEDDGIPYTYAILDDGTVEIRSYTGHRKFITVPEKIDGRVVSSIGDNAFAGQVRLREINLPDGLTRIGAKAFSGCSNLLSIQIPANVTQIGEYGFADNVRLHTVCFAGNQLRNIGDFAFFDCGSLEQLELPSGVEYVEGSAFLGTTGMQNITVQSGNKSFVSRDGVLFNADGSRIVAYPAGREGAYALENGCEIIGEYAFACAKITEIDLTAVNEIREAAFLNAALETLSIPDSVTSVQKDAFSQNTNLKQVEIGRGLTTISSGMFSGCVQLRDIVIPEGIEKIGDSAFFVSGLKHVIFAPDSRLKSIDHDAFFSCAIETLHIPDSVNTIGDRVFRGNPLTDVVLPSGLEVIGELAFADTDLLSVYIPQSVSNLGAGAFAYCHSLTDISVESGNATYHAIDGVVYSLDSALLHTYPAGKRDNAYTMEQNTTGIAAYAFSGASNLKTVSLSDVLTDINEYAFDYAGITMVTLPDSIIRLGRYAFTNCMDLSQVIFHPTSGLTRIGYGAFVNCGLTAFTVPASVSTMGQRVFQNCDALTSVTFAENSCLESLSAYIFSGCSNLRAITFLPGSALRSIQAHGLEGMEKLTDIDFGDAQVTDIGNFAFRFCTALNNLELPETLTNVGRYAFYGCENLSELVLPEHVEHIGSYAFLGTEELQLYMAAERLPEYLDEDWDRGIAGYYVGVTNVSTSGDYRYAVLASGNIAVLEYLGSAELVDLSTTNLGGDITAIGGKAFRNSAVTSVTLPDTLEEIQAEAFKDSRLNGVTIPANVIFIGREAFAGTDIAELIFTPGSQIKTIEQRAFAETKNLTDVILPDSVMTLGTGVFQNSGLRDIAFESGIQLVEIPQRAFMGTQLESVILPDSVTLVNHSAFNGVSALKHVTFGYNDGIRLMSNAFYRTGLTELSIPANVTYIGEFCFVGLENLNDIAVDANNPNYISESGLLLDKSGRKLIAVPAGRTGSLTVPVSVEEIGFGAFEGSALNEVKFETNANILTLGCRAFFQAENLKKISIPASVVSIDYYAFAYCENLHTVMFAEENGLTGIYEGAFCGDVALENIVLPDTIVEISDFAFYGCGELEKIPVQDDLALKGIYDYAFAYTGLRGDLVMPDNLVDIGNYAFLGIKAESVEISDTKQKELVIGLGAFEDCENLKQIKLPFIGASFEDEQFTWLSYIFGAGDYSNKDTVGDVVDVYVPESLRTVTITEGIRFIGTGGFSNCVGLETIHIPQSVNTLYPDAFRNTTAEHSFGGAIAIHDPEGLHKLDKGYFGQGITGTLELQEGITTIGFQSFAVCESLEYVRIPEGVKTIDSSAFYGCSGLKCVDIPNSVESIGGLAFYGCRSLRQIAFPSGVSKIEDYTFEYCASLTDFEIPNGVTELGQHAFYGCTGLDRVTLPETLTSIGTDAFYGCTSLFDVKNNSALELNIGSSDQGMAAYYAKKLTDCQGNVFWLNEESDFEYVETPDGFRFLREGGQYKLVAYVGEDETVTLPEDCNGEPYQLYYFTGATNVIIPEGTTQIDDYAFYDSATLRNVVIPQSVKRIGDYAFRNTGVRELVIPDGVESIGQEAFCSASIREIQLPDTLRSIGYRAFSSTDLVSITIPDSVTELGDSALNNCLKLRNAVLPDGLTRIQSGLFLWCEQLEHIEIPSSVKEIGSSAFSGCKNLRSIIIHDGLEYIESSAFKECVALKSIDLPDTLINIGSNAFRECSAMNSLYIPENVTFIGGAAFDRTLKVEIDPDNSSYCMVDGILYDKQLTTIIQVTDAIGKHVVIPDGITEIPSFAFAESAELESVQLPDSVQRIGESAFQNCVRLNEIELPDGVTSISIRAFAGCRSLTELVIPDNVGYIGYDAFAECSALTEIKLPGSMTNISQQLFYGCRSLKSVQIPEGVTSISNGAFYMCSALTEIRIPASVTRIDSDAFSHCEKLYVVYNDSDLMLSIDSGDHGNLAHYAKMVVDKNGNVTYRDGASGFEMFDTDDGLRFVKENGEYVLLGYMGDNPTVTIPESIDGHDYTFRMFFGGEHIILPESLNEIPMEAFVCNGTVKQVSIPGNVVKIGQSAFSNCHNLQSISIPDQVREIGNTAFYNCTSLECITIPDSVKILGERCFESCENLRQIELPDGLESVGWRLVENTGISNNPDNWNSGGLILNGYLLAVRDDAEYLDYTDHLQAVARNAYSETTQLKNAIYCGSMDGAANVETMIVLEYAGIPEPPVTLKNVILTERVTSSDLYNNPYFFRYMNDVTIFVEDEERNLRWNDNFPGWNSGNRVIYGDGWIWTKFYDTDGTLILSEPRRTSEVIRRPVVTGAHGANGGELIGWDLNGDGKPDAVPATSVADIEAVAVWNDGPKTYTVTFMDVESGEIYSRQRLSYGATITPPENPEKADGIFEGWTGYSEGMTVTGDIVFTARWHTHHYEAIVTDPTCTHDGYTTHICACGYSYVDSPVDRIDHQYENGYCVDCGEAEPVEVPEVIATGWSGATQWRLTDDGILTIYGEGNMKNYGYNGGQPWLNRGVDITEVVIEEGVTAIGTGAFRNLTTLETVHLPESGLTKIGEAAFYGCTALKEITIPENIYTVWAYTFKGCTSLEKVKLPKTLIKIDQGAFENCTGLTYMFCPTNLEIIGSWSFKGCTALEEVEMQWTDATEIREGAFKNCSALTIIRLPANIQTLGDSCFYGIGAAEFTVPETVRNIEPWCFARAYSLTDIVFEGDAPEIGEGAFNKITLNAHYPEDNATWTSDVMQNYGGTVSWSAY